MSHPSIDQLWDFIYDLVAEGKLTEKEADKMTAIEASNYLERTFEPDAMLITKDQQFYGSN